MQRETEQDEQVADHSSDDDTIQISDLERSHTSPRWLHLNWRRPDRRQQKLSLALTALLLVLVIGWLVMNTPDLQSILSRAFAQDTSGGSKIIHIFLQSNPSWGEFVLDGKPLTTIPVLGSSSPLAISTGKHQVSWSAEPFAIITCELTILSAFAITKSCPDSTLNIEVYNSFPLLSFSTSLAYLNSQQHTGLTTLMQETLDALMPQQGMVEAGEYYAVQLGQSQACRQIAHFVQLLCYTQAQENLYVTLRAHLISDGMEASCITSDSCFWHGQDCRLFCPDPQFPAKSSGQIWQVRVVVQLSWSYLNQAQRVVNAYQPVTFLANHDIYQSLHFDLTYQDQRWSILNKNDLPGEADDAICLEGQHAIVSNPGTYPMLTVTTHSDISAPPVQGDCLLVLSLRNYADQSPNKARQASLLERFGVLLAVNDIAQENWPDLPIANPGEQARAHELSNM